MDKLKEENKELQMKIVQLETEIKNNHKKQAVYGQPIYHIGEYFEYR